MIKESRFPFENFFSEKQEETRQEFFDLQHCLDEVNVAQKFGKIKTAVGTVLRATLEGASIGDLCKITDHNLSLNAEVIALDKKEVILLPLGSLGGLSSAAVIQKINSQFAIEVGDHLLGKVLDGLGNVTDTIGAEKKGAGRSHFSPVQRLAPDPLKRPLVSQPFLTGVRAIDMFITCAQGQRLAIMASPGLGKTTLMGMILRGSEAEVVVVALVGERGREVREFIDLEMQGNIRDKTVLVVSTSDKPPVEQAKCAFVAQTVAEYFRDQGKKVLLFTDSITRFARAQREIGLSAGEPPTRGGFPPSVFLAFPKLMERAGNSEKGSITAFYTVLMEGEHTHNDPIADEVKSIVDGHIVLSRIFSEKGHFPAIHVLGSLSRVADRIINKAQLEAVRKIRLLISKYDEVELLVRVGEYQKGSDPVADEAIKKYPKIMKFLQQDIHAAIDFKESLKALLDLANRP